MQQPARYHAFDREFRVEQDAKTKRWWAVGHARGHRPFYLDRLGSRDTEQAMQAALDGWAARHGATRVRSAAERQTVEQFELL